jgi:hypothetical protein
MKSKQQGIKTELVKPAFVCTEFWSYKYHVNNDLFFIFM